MVRYVVRAAASAKTLTVTAILTLAVGIGGVTAMFSVIDAALIRSVPFPNASRLLVIWHGDSQDSSRIAEISHYTYRLWRVKARSFSDIAAMGSVNWSLDLVGRGARRAVPHAAVSSSFFRTLGVQPAMGREFTENDDRPGAQRVVIISHSFWQSVLGGEPNIVGQTLMLGGISRTVIGVMPATFEFPREAAMWVPVVPEIAGLRIGQFDALEAPGFGILYVVARLGEHATAASAARELASIDREDAAAHGHTGVMPPEITTAIRDFVSNNTRSALVALAATSAGVLLIACLNICSLLLMRVSSARRAFAIRAALGASRFRIAREELAVAGCLSLVGSLLGAAIAAAAVRGVQALAPPGAALLERASVDERALAAAIVACAVTILLCGVAPAFRAAYAMPGHLLAGRSTGSGSTNRFRTVLTVVQVALAVVVLLLSALALRSAQKIRAIDLGFDPANLVTVRASLPDVSLARQRQFSRDLTAALRRLPDVQGAAGVSLIPLQLGLIGSDMSFLVEGQRRFPGLDAQKNPIVVSEVVTPGYFAAMHTPILRGRDFTEDDDERRPRVVIVSDGLARALWPTQDPLGRRLQLDSVPAGTPEAQRWCTVVGVVADIRYRGVTDSRPDLYEPYTQAGDAVPQVMVRSASRLPMIVAAVRDAARRLQPQAQVGAAEPMETVIARATVSWTLNMWMFSGLGATGLLLAAIGLYGVLSHFVAERTRELAVRVALGATPMRLRVAVLSRGVLLTFSGLVGGIAIAAAAAGAAERIVYGVRPLDRQLIVLVCLILVAAAILAAYVPARRATSIDPAVVLRSE
jgi:predicted permease